MTAKPTSPPQTANWKIDRNPSDPSAKWEPKVSGGGWRQPSGQGVPASIPPELYAWVKNIGEWNQMMHEAVVDLRRRVEELEKSK